MKIADPRGRKSFTFRTRSSYFHSSSLITEPVSSGRKSSFPAVVRICSPKIQPHPCWPHTVVCHFCQLRGVVDRSTIAESLMTRCAWQHAEQGSHFANQSNALS